MPELQNKFSWSVSAREDFEVCPRRRYWSKYAMWHGWKSSATPLQRTAYRLNKMDNRFTIQGNAVERAVMWALTQTRLDVAPDPEQTYQTAARNYLNQCWSDSKNERWRGDPKRHCCLHEHYYPDNYNLSEQEMVENMMTTVKTCITNFTKTLLPELAAIPAANEIAVATTAVGDPESFMLDEIKIYAIPDYVIRVDGALRIYDWKSGRPRPAHKDQMDIYGLWAHCRHRRPDEPTTMHLAYLAEPRLLSAELMEDGPARTTAMIKDSVAHMAEYLENGDIQANRPLPSDHWEMCPDMHVCYKCNFYELCRPELES
ncbi:MAG: PD-(D/E)XK nuclease family protein [Kiritimatiellia bacterium]|nr:PD-(D/E)XK nuclease family protein [Lentisphaerota bacterium]